MENEEKPPLLVTLKYYITLTLGLVSCLSCFVFMFMVPFFLEPSISTLVANFDPDPVVCRTVYTEHFKGMKNCSWSSCRHGCTIDQYDCKRVYVDYMMTRYSEYEGTEVDDNDKMWTVRGVPVFVNIKACGYPPTTNCSVFGDMYAPIGSTFPCYYSRVDPKLVVTDYSWDKAVHSLIMALVIPNLLTGVSLGILSYWWYPGCQRKNSQYELPPDQETAESPHEDSPGEEEDDDASDEGGEGDRNKKAKMKSQNEPGEFRVSIPGE